MNVQTAAMATGGVWDLELVSPAGLLRDIAGQIAAANVAMQRERFADRRLCEGNRQRLAGPPSRP